MNIQIHGVPKNVFDVVDVKVNFHLIPASSFLFAIFLPKGGKTISEKHSCTLKNVLLQGSYFWDTLYSRIQNTIYVCGGLVCMLSVSSVAR